MIYPNLVAKRFIILIEVKADSFRLAVKKEKKNQMVYILLFGIAALIPLVFSFQKASHMPLQATNVQFTYTANTSCMPWKNDKLLMESTFLVR